MSTNQPINLKSFFKNLQKDKQAKQGNIHKVCLTCKNLQKPPKTSKNLQKQAKQGNTHKVVSNLQKPQILLFYCLKYCFFAQVSNPADYNIVISREKNKDYNIVISREKIKITIL